MAALWAAPFPVNAAAVAIFAGCLVGIPAAVHLQGPEEMEPGSSPKLIGAHFISASVTAALAGWVISQEIDPHGALLLLRVRLDDALHGVLVVRRPQVG